MALIRKIGVIGQGHVGAHVANSLLMQGVADELYLADINAQKLESECQDLTDSMSFYPHNCRVVNCGEKYELLAGCDVVVNAAGDVAKAAGDRDGELFVTAEITRTWPRRLVDAGFENQIMLSNDMGKKSHHQSYGYGPGWGFIKQKFIPRLLDEGFSEEVVHKFMYENPARFYALRK